MRAEQAGGMGGGDQTGSGSEEAFDGIDPIAAAPGIRNINFKGGLKHRRTFLKHHAFS